MSTGPVVYTCFVPAYAIAKVAANGNLKTVSELSQRPTFTCLVGLRSKHPVVTHTHHHAKQVTRLRR